MDYAIAASRLTICKETHELVWLNGKRAGVRAGWLTDDGYIYLQLSGRKIPAHKVVWLLVHNFWPDQIDHINGNKSDNRIENLRLCTDSQNQMNRTLEAKNSSGHRGVWLKKGKWAAKITKDKKQHFLGYFDNKEEAIAAYLTARKKMFGEFA